MRNAEWTKDARVVTTRDFSFAAVLLVNGFALLGTEPDSAEAPRRRRFVLRGDPETFAKLSRCLLLDDVLVPARAFALAQRRLKRLLYDEPQGGTNVGEGTDRP
ncbi:MAG TPA: hypothetical protein VFC31_01500 [Candidatus Limnocylindria bacterium]|nr:hypothetical protein [Candidatus Limnocylindria bacterium]